MPNQIIAQLNQNAQIKQVLSQVKQQNFSLELTIEKLLSDSWNTWLINVKSGNDNDALGILRASKMVKIAQFNHYLTRRVIPNDPEFLEQWNLENTGQRGGTPGADISAAKAWDFGTSGVTATGDTIVVAIIDGGFDLQHEDLRFWINRLEIPNNGIDDEPNGYIDDYNGWNAGNSTGTIPSDYHGTHVAGIAAAIGDNNTGIAGVAWNARILALSVFDFVESEVVEAYGYMFDMRRLYNISGGAEGAFVVSSNSSFGLDYEQPEDHPLWTAMYDSLGSVGILSAASTTNFAANVDAIGDVPSSCPSDHLIIVTNTTRHDDLSPSAGFGLTTVDIGAPGTGVRSTTPNNNYGNSSGTSMAAPHLAGAVAAMFSSACIEFMQAYHDKPDSVALIIKRYLLAGADKTSGLDGFTVSGGRLNLFRSMEMFHKDVCTNCIKYDASVNMIDCHGDKDGAVDLTVNAGLPPFTFHWSSGDSTEDISGIGADEYFVVIEDDTGCQKLAYFNLDAPDEMTIDFSEDIQSGSLSAIASGGMPPYSYQWDDPNHSTNPLVINLNPGVYTLTVTDANGCQKVQSVGLNITGLAHIHGSISLEVYPNPGNGFFSIVYRNSTYSNIELRVTSLLGKRLTSKLFPNQKEFKTQLNLSHLEHGIYLMQVLSDNRILANKKIVLH